MAGLRTVHPLGGLLGGSIKGGRGRKAPLQRPGLSGKPRRRAASSPTPPRMPEATCKIPDDPVAAPLPRRPLRGCRPYRLQAGRRLIPTGGHCAAAGCPPRRPPPPSFGSAPTCATARSGIDTISWAELGSSLAMTGGTPFPFENLFWPGAEASTGLEFLSIHTRARRPARGRRGRCRPECACPADRQAAAFPGLSAIPSGPTRSGRRRGRGSVAARLAPTAAARGNRDRNRTGISTGGPATWLC